MFVAIYKKLFNLCDEPLTIIFRLFLSKAMMFFHNFWFLAQCGLVGNLSNSNNYFSCVQGNIRFEVAYQMGLLFSGLYVTLYMTKGRLAHDSGLSDFYQSGGSIWMTSLKVICQSLFVLCRSNTSRFSITCRSHVSWFDVFSAAFCLHWYFMMLSFIFIFKSGAL